jgi:hypothetical protein
MLSGTLLLTGTLLVSCVQSSPQNPSLPQIRAHPDSPAKPDTAKPDTAKPDTDTNTALALPDLIVDPNDLGAFLTVNTLDVKPDACELVDRCVGAAGARRVLRFLTTTANIGTADLVLGVPEDHPEHFSWSECDHEWKYAGFASYKLLDPSGNVAAVGGKSAFCIMDERNYAEDGSGPVYTCGTQGLSVGWADVYSAGLDCQWIDVTDVPAGDYTLEVSVAPNGMLAELSHDNNSASVPVSIAAPITAPITAP